jgi:hypothetical protein
VSRQLLGITGFARSGKDAIADQLVASGWTKVGSVKPVYRILLDIDPLVELPTRRRRIQRLSAIDARLGYEATKAIPEVRRLLQELGVAGRKMFGGAVWISVACDAVPEGRVVVTGLRHEDEVRWIEEQGGVVVRVERPGVGPLNGGHETERELLGAQGYVVVNDGALSAAAGALLAIAALHFQESAA